ncbi:sulfite exporter TauE/SafE family protein [Paraburkholderia sp. SIMBA_049]
MEKQHARSTCEPGLSFQSGEDAMIDSSALMTPELTFVTILVAFAGVFVISFMKGAFGGGFSIIGIPLLSFVMDPVTAGGLLAPLFIAMDLFALRYWKPSTWSKPDLVLLLPGLVTGIGFGYLTFRFLDHRAIAVVMAMITLFFVGVWLLGGATLTTRPRSTSKAITAGVASGVTTMVAHSGGPPLAMYLLPLGLSKEVYAGTTSLFFTVGNATKAVPWLLLAKPTFHVWTLMAVCVCAIPVGVVSGWRLHAKLDQRQVYRICYGLLVVAALKLLWDGVTGYLA